MLWRVPESGAVFFALFFFTILFRITLYSIGKKKMPYAASYFNLDIQIFVFVRVTCMVKCLQMPLSQLIFDD